MQMISNNLYQCYISVKQVLSNILLQLVLMNPLAIRETIPNLITTHNACPTRKSEECRHTHGRKWDQSKQLKGSFQARGSQGPLPANILLVGEES